MHRHGSLTVIAILVPARRKHLEERCCNFWFPEHLICHNEIYLVGGGASPKKKIKNVEFINSQSSICQLLFTSILILVCIISTSQRLFTQFPNNSGTCKVCYVNKEHSDISCTAVSLYVIYLLNIKFIIQTCYYSHIIVRAVNIIHNLSTAIF